MVSFDGCVMTRRTAVWTMLAGGSFPMLAKYICPALPPPNALPDWIAPLEIDGVTLFVPVAWAAGRPWSIRPWPNGVQIQTGGWGQFTPWLGPIEGAERLLHDQTFRADSANQQTRANQPDPFFYITATFEFPEPAPERTWYGGVQRQKTFFPFDLDRLTFTYCAPKEEKVRPFVALLTGASPKDGEDVGSGWRQLTRQYDKREIMLRFDAHDWQGRGGPLPMRLAASFSAPFWSHFERLDEAHWTANFETQKLPINHWRARYETADSLFRWLLTSPEARDASRRFQWWTDLRYRPEK